jgi:hypothetical protein
VFEIEPNGDLKAGTDENLWPPVGHLAAASSARLGPDGRWNGYEMLNQVSQADFCGANRKHFFWGFVGEAVQEIDWFAFDYHLF